MMEVDLLVLRVVNEFSRCRLEVEPLSFGAADQPEVWNYPEAEFIAVDDLQYDSTYLVRHTDQFLTLNNKTQRSSGVYC